MAQFNQLVLTTKGIALITKALAGDCKIKFTKMQSGDGDWATDLTEATALKSEKQEIGISEIKAVNDTTVDMLAILSNSDLTEGYYIKEIGIFGAEDGSEDTTEVLYGIVTSVDGKADYMPPYNSISPQTMEIETLVTVANASDVTIKTGTGALASADTVEKLSDDVDAMKITLSDASTRVDGLEKVVGTNGYNILALDVAVSLLHKAEVAGTSQNVAVEVFSDDSSFRLADGIYDSENHRIYA